MEEMTDAGEVARMKNIDRCVTFIFFATKQVCWQRCCFDLENGSWTQTRLFAPNRCVPRLQIGAQLEREFYHTHLVRRIRRDGT